MTDEDSELPVPAGEAEPALSETEQMAVAVVAVLDRLEANIPSLRPPNPQAKRRARGARTVSREFVLSAMSMVEASKVVREMSKVNSARTRRAVESRDSFRRISERLAMFVASVSHTMETEWADAVRSAMDAYRWGNILVSTGEHDELIPHLEILRRHLGRAGGPKGKKGEEE